MNPTQQPPGNPNKSDKWHIDIMARLALENADLSQSVYRLRQQLSDRDSLQEMHLKQKRYLLWVTRVQVIIMTFATLAALLNVGSNSTTRLIWVGAWLLIVPACAYGIGWALGLRRQSP